MRKLLKCVPAVLSVIFVCATVYAQQAIRLPANLKNQLMLPCTICTSQPASQSIILPVTDNTSQFRTYYHNSIVSLFSGDLDEAYTYALQTITHTDSGVYPLLYQYAYFIKAKVLYYKKLYAQAITEYRRLLPHVSQDNVLSSNIYTNLGECYLEQSRFADAMQYFTDWAQRFTIGSDPYSAKAVYQNSGLCLFYMHRYKEAEQSLLKALSIDSLQHDTLGFATSYTNLANLYYNQYQDGKAIPCFEKSLQYAQKAGDIETLISAYLNMAVVDENRGRLKSALAYRKQYEQLRDSAWNRDHIWKLASQEKKFAIQLKENKIHLLEQQTLASKEQMKTQRWQRNTFLAAAIGFLLIAGFVFAAYRDKARKNEIISRQKEALAILNTTKDRLYSIVAHDLRSPVYSLKNNLLKIKGAMTQNHIAEAGDLLNNTQRIANSAYSLLDNLLHWTLSQTDQLLFAPQRLQLSTVAKQVCFDYVPLAATKDIMVQQDVPTGLFIQADINCLKIVLRNLLDNAIKYTPPGGRIYISATTHQQQCSLRIEDSGIGMDEQTLGAVQQHKENSMPSNSDTVPGTGFGLPLCQLMVQKNKGILNITSKKNEGTRITLLFPLYPSL